MSCRQQKDKPFIANSFGSMWAKCTVNEVYSKKNMCSHAWKLTYTSKDLLYDYSPDLTNIPTTVSVKISLHHGLITDWYQLVTFVGPVKYRLFDKLLETNTTTGKSKELSIDLKLKLLHWFEHVWKVTWSLFQSSCRTHDQLFKQYF